MGRLQALPQVPKVLMLKMTSLSSEFRCMVCAYLVCRCLLKVCWPVRLARLLACVRCLSPLPVMMSRCACLVISLLSCVVWR